jgi:hypothetical protein
VVVWILSLVRGQRKKGVSMANRDSSGGEWTINAGSFLQCEKCGGVVENGEPCYAMKDSKGREVTVCHLCSEEKGDKPSESFDQYVDCDCEDCKKVAAIIAGVTSVIEAAVVDLDSVRVPDVVQYSLGKAGEIVRHIARNDPTTVAEAYGACQSLSALFSSRITKDATMESLSGSRSLNSLERMAKEISLDDMRGLPKEAKQQIRQLCRSIGVSLPPGLDDDEGNKNGHLH